MYVTDLVWRAHAAFTLGVIVFMLFFVRQVTRQGG